MNCTAPTAAGPYHELKWEDLVPTDWDPIKRFKSRNLANLDDGSLRAEELQREMRSLWDNALRATRSMTLRRLPWIWLLPLLLLLGQSGQFRHELDHYTQATAAKSQKQRPADADRCDLCLAYGHLSAAAKPEAASPRLRVDLGFRRPAGPSIESADSALPTARNRGPPAV